MITCMETIFPSLCAELNYDTKTLGTEMNPKYQSRVHQLVQIPQFIVSGIRRVCVGRLNVKAD